MLLSFTDDLSTFQAADFKGFFVGWPTAPSENALYQTLQAAYRVVIATDQEQVVGFINAISDGQMSAYIPLLEVRPEFQGRGIGKALLRQITERLSHLYMVDLCCDPELKPFYQGMDFEPLQGMCLRHYERLQALTNL